MADLIDPSEIMFTPFEPKTKNRFIMYIEGVPAYLIKTANRPTTIRCTGSYGMGKITQRVCNW